LAEHPLKNNAEIEIRCPRCGYCMMRTAAGLRHRDKIECPACGEVVVPGSRERGDDVTS
jgi:endogenous inhibitor of DNA gyrase (YacG/DUF329 family)